MTAIRRTVSGAPAPDSFPRWFLVGAGALVLFSLASVGLVRLTGNGPDQRRAAEPEAVQRPLRFEDRPDGSIAVVDGRTGQLVTTVQGEQGFLRGSLRALSRERRARGLGSEQPFQLIARPDGRLTLVDPVTDQRIELESFGATNAGTFARLLEPPKGP
jgi:putative photosynthetic complex assembly protein